MGPSDLLRYAAPLRARYPLALLAVVGATLFLTRLDGVFTIDEDSYVATVAAMGAGRLTVPGTEGLLPSKELLSFDANPNSRVVRTTPVSPTVPPLYALMALPFAGLGWPGLVALQILSFLGIAFLIFQMTAQNARGAHTPWLAMLTFLAGGYSLEYAQGVWPQMLSAFLCFCAFHLLMRARTGGAIWRLAAAGCSAGLAIGVRYQNLAFVILLLAGALIVTPGRRARTACFFVAGLVGPLLACAAINAVRLGSWNPVSKGPGYVTVVQSSGSIGQTLADAVTSTWARVVDRAATRYPPLDAKEQWLKRDHATGAVLLDGAMKKAWLQSAPWILLALAGLVRGWTRGRARRAELRAASLIVAGMLGLFALNGFRRHDGMSFNERYLLELVPMLAVVAAWELDDLSWRWLWLVAGAAAGALLPLAAMIDPGLFDRVWVLSVPPLMLAISCVVLRFASADRTVTIALLMGACLGWALSVHLTDDLPASRRLRRVAAARLAAAVEALPRAEPSAIFAEWGARNALGPLLLDHDLVIVDPAIDGGADAPTLFEQLRARRRRIFCIDAVPEALRVVCARQRPFQSREVTFVECL